MKTSITTVALILAVAQFRLVGATLDDFSGTTLGDSANYTTLLSFGTPAEPFSINGSSQLQPTSTGSGVTTTYLWKNATLAVGDTVSIDIVNIDGESDLAGLAFTTSPTSANGSGDNYVFAGIVGSGGTDSGPATVADVDINSTSGGSGTLDFSDNKFVTESVTRTLTGLHYTFSGSALTPTLSGNFAVSAYDDQTVYFGINIYGGTTPGGQIVDNFDLTVPEPSTYAMLLGGVGMLALVARGRKLFRA